MVLFSAVWNPVSIKVLLRATIKGGFGSVVLRPRCMCNYHGMYVLANELCFRLAGDQSEAELKQTFTQDRRATPVAQLPVLRNKVLSVLRIKRKPYSLPAEKSHGVFTQHTKAQ